LLEGKLNFLMATMVTVGKKKLGYTAAFGYLAVKT
jgi:hypothetical protein